MAEVFLGIFMNSPADEPILRPGSVKCRPSPMAAAPVAQAAERVRLYPRVPRRTERFAEAESHITEARFRLASTSHRKTNPIMPDVFWLQPGIFQCLSCSPTLHR
jgi:hypothetical protein